MVSLRRRIGAYADLGRFQGISTSATIPIVGALTSTAPFALFNFMDPNAVDLYDIVAFTLISIFAHTAPNAYIEANDLELDSQIKESQMKPLVSGVLTRKDAMNFAAFGVLMSFILTFIFYPFNFLAMICLGLSALWVMWYGCGHGKKLPLSYDYSFSIAYTFYCLFGSYAVGHPTIYTWIFIGIVFTAGTAFAQWENALKDVDYDRSVGVKSFAVMSGIDSKTKLTLRHPYVVYGIGIKSAFIAFCFWAYLLTPTDYFYLLFILLYGIPSQAFIMWRFVKKRGRLEHRRTILYDVPLTAFLAFSVLIGKLGFFAVIGLIVYLIVGYFIGSALQYGTEFKFGRYSRKYEKSLS